MKKSLIALAFGTLALGMTEFVMMGILAETVSISVFLRQDILYLPMHLALHVGAPMALAAAVLMVVFYRKYER